jgi:hypothetical protein
VQLHRCIKIHTPKALMSSRYKDTCFSRTGHHKVYNFYRNLKPRCNVATLSISKLQKKIKSFKVWLKPYTKCPMRFYRNGIYFPQIYETNLHILVWASKSCFNCALGNVSTGALGNNLTSVPKAPYKHQSVGGYKFIIRCIYYTRTYIVIEQTYEWQR